MQRIDPRVLALLRTLFLVIVLVTALGRLPEVVAAYKAMPTKLGNQKRDRVAVMAHINDYDEEAFKAHTGFSRKVFNYILNLIRPLMRKNRAMGELSSGSHIPTALALFVYMRMLRGARALDMDWVGVCPNHVWDNQ
jgi:hypothetical protein